MDHVMIHIHANRFQLGCCQKARPSICDGLCPLMGVDSRTHACPRRRRIEIRKIKIIITILHKILYIYYHFGCHGLLPPSPRQLALPYTITSHAIFNFISKYRVESPISIRWLTFDCYSISLASTELRVP